MRGQALPLNKKKKKKSNTADCSIFKRQKQVVVLLSSPAGYFDVAIGSSCDLTQHRHLRANFLTVAMFWQFLEVKFSSLHAETNRTHMRSQKHTDVLRKQWPATLQAGVFQPSCLACRHYPANQSWESCKARKALVLDTCLLLARGDIFTLWPEEISTLLLFSHFSAHRGVWFSSNWSDIPHFPQETSAT